MSTPAGVGRIAVNSLEALPSLPIGRRQRQVLDAITELCREGRRPSDQDTAAYLGGRSTASGGATGWCKRVASSKAATNAPKPTAGSVGGNRPPNSSNSP